MRKEAIWKWQSSLLHSGRMGGEGKKEILCKMSLAFLSHMETLGSIKHLFCSKLLKESLLHLDGNHGNYLLGKSEEKQISSP